MTATRKAPAIIDKTTFLFTPLGEPVISKGTQSVLFVALYKVDGHKVRTTIKSDSYASQSEAVAHIWSTDSLKWNLVASVPFSLMRTPTKLYYLPNDGGCAAYHFRTDEAELLRQVATILL